MALQISDIVEDRELSGVPALYGWKPDLFPALMLTMARKYKAKGSKAKPKILVS